MISIYQFKPAFQSQLRPLVAGMAQMGIKANQITIAAVILSLLMGAAIAVMPQSRRLWLLLPIVLIIRMALNAMDGMLASEHHQKTREMQWKSSLQRPLIASPRSIFWY